MAEKFLSTVVSQYALPECIVSDYDPQFSGHFWDELMSLQDMTLTFGATYHPQTNGMVKVMNCTMEQLL